MWTAARGKILTMDNLRKQNICTVEWCCMCKVNRETMDHLLLHCDFVQSLWSLVFCLFRLQWVTPKRVDDLLACWKGGFGRYHSADIWGYPFMSDVDY